MALEVSQLLMSWLNDLAPWNVLYIFFTEEYPGFQCLIEGFCSVKHVPHRSHLASVPVADVLVEDTSIVEHIGTVLAAADVSQLPMS